MAASDFDDGVTRAVPHRAAMRTVLGAALLGLAFLLVVRTEASFDARATLLVFAAMTIGWVVLRLPQTPVALAGALALVAFDVAEDNDLFEPLGSEIVWIMVAAFLVSAVLSETGLAGRLSMAVLSRAVSVPALFWLSTAMISATAFLVPSTSARAAILLPVFSALAAALPEGRIVRGLGLLFPTVILLSAAASLTGAGAHLVAAEFVDRVSDLDIGYGEWMLFGLPVAAATSAIACAILLHVFLDAGDRAMPIVLPPPPRTVRGRERIVIAVALLVVALFATEALHGLSLGIVGISGALVLCARSVSGVGFAAALKKVDWDLLVFLAATLCVGEALLETGAAEHLVGLGLSAAREAADGRTWPILLGASCLSALAHLVVISRTARATVLIPALALPLAGFGIEPHILILTATVGSGFCQTFAVSAKPVTVFAAGEDPPFDGRDLMRLALWLFVPFVLTVTCAALWLWPLIPLAD